MANVKAVIIGQTGKGKSQVLLNDALKQSKTHEAVVFLCNEVSEEKLKDLIANLISKTDSNGKMTSEELNHECNKLIIAKSKEDLVNLVNNKKADIGKYAIAIDMILDEDKELNEILSKFKTVTIAMQKPVPLEPSKDFNFELELDKLGLKPVSKEEFELISLK